MNKNKPGLRSYRVKRTYDQVPESVKKYLPSIVITPQQLKDYFNNPLPDSFINPGTAVTTVTTSQRQKEQNSLKPPPSDNPQ